MIGIEYRGPENNLLTFAFSLLEDEPRTASVQRVQRGDANVGFFMLVPEAAGLVLHTLCVVPHYQIQGIGSEIMGDIIDKARRSHVPLTLSVLKTNRRARAFYERLNFANVGESSHHYQFRHFPPAA